MIPPEAPQDISIKEPEKVISENGPKMSGEVVCFCGHQFMHDLNSNMVRWYGQFKNKGQYNKEAYFESIRRIRFYIENKKKEAAKSSALVLTSIRGDKGV